MDIFIASDHAGFELKKKLSLFLKREGFSIVDFGPHEFDENDDYPDFVAPLAHEISQNHEGRGIVIGGSGIGEAIVANRFPNVRAVVYNGEVKSYDGKPLPNPLILSREHNNANVLSFGARIISEEGAKAALLLWLKSPFSQNDRHVRRLKKVETLSPCGVKEVFEIE